MHPFHTDWLFLEFKWPLVKMWAGNRLPPQEEIIQDFSQITSSMNTTGFSHINLSVRQKSVHEVQSTLYMIPHYSGMLFWSKQLPPVYSILKRQDYPRQFLSRLSCSSTLWITSDPCHTFLKETWQNLKTLGAESLLLIPKVKYCTFPLA